MVFFGLRPVDAWVFRDATPMEGFFLASEGFNIFPPSPLTLFGAFRAAIARLLGWTGRGSWSGDKRVLEVVGDGWEDIGRLRLMGPLVAREGQLVFPAPWCLLGKEDEEGFWSPQVIARPAEEVLCDMGRVRLVDWDHEEEKLVPPSGWWITARGLDQVLRGELPRQEELISIYPGRGRGGWLWSEEDRIGIAIDPQTRAAATGMIYGCRYLRLAEGVEVVVGVEVLEAQGAHEGWEEELISQLEREIFVSVGGKGRMGLLRRIEDWGWPFEAHATTEDTSSLPMVMVLTPLGPLGERWWEQELILEPEGGPSEIRLGIVSGCCPRPIRIGRWSFQEGPGTKYSYLAPGSVVFCEYLERPSPRPWVGQWGRCWLKGSKHQTDLGFGLVVIGEWRNRND